MAALGAGGEFRDAATGEPDGGRPLSGEAGLRRDALRLGSPYLYRRALGAGVLRACSCSMRGWGTTWFGSALASLAYAFGAPILFQYCNVIYLVGAAWLPLGVHAVDRWVRRGRRWGLHRADDRACRCRSWGATRNRRTCWDWRGSVMPAGLAWQRSRSPRRACNDRSHDVLPETGSPWS